LLNAVLLNKERWRASAKGDNIWLLERTFPGCDKRATGKNSASWPVELYVTPAPIETQHGWRHLTLMAALLQRFGEPFYREVQRLRLDEGLKGEAAMCTLLSLAGDPYQALLTLEGKDLATVIWQTNPACSLPVARQASAPVHPPVAQLDPAARPRTAPYFATGCPQPTTTENPNPLS
ncbi:MAG: DUF4269 domain-containing protein, partial [Aeromonas sobria]